MTNGELIASLLRFPYNQPVEVVGVEIVDVENVGYGITLVPRDYIGDISEYVKFKADMKVMASGLETLTDEFEE